MSLADRLTPRQIDIARCIARGLTLLETAAELGLSIYTVRQHCYADGGLYDRLAARSVVDVARAVWRAEGVSDEPTEGKPAERDWTVREGAIHWVPDPLPAGEKAYTDYGGDDCQLRRRRLDDRAREVHVTEPLFPGARVKVKAINGEYWAVRD